MTEYQFSLIVPIPVPTENQILDVTDSLGNAGCTDTSVRGHSDGIELLFERTADSLQTAISSAITDVERAGFRVAKVEMQREAIRV
jgi:hypothetical protein